MASHRRPLRKRSRHTIKERTCAAHLDIRRDAGVGQFDPSCRNISRGWPTATAFLQRSSSHPLVHHARRRKRPGTNGGGGSPSSFELRIGEAELSAWLCTCATKILQIPSKRVRNYISTLLLLVKSNLNRVIMMWCLSFKALRYCF